MEQASGNEAWVEQRKIFINNIKNFKPTKDRIILTAQIIYMHNAINDSSKGWRAWLNAWLSTEIGKKMNMEPVIATLTDKELEEVFEIMKEFAINYLVLDIKITQIIEKRLMKISKKINKGQRNLFPATPRFDFKEIGVV